MTKWLSTTTFLLLVSTSLQAQDRALTYLFLNWASSDTSTTMQVNYGTPRNSTESQVRYDTVSRAADPEAYRFRATGSSRTVGEVPTRFHSVELTGLEPGQTIYFVAGDSKKGFSAERKFRTIAESGPVQFINGGDMGVWGAISRIEKVAAEKSPDFALIGGDIAYADGSLKKWSRWQRWLELWTENMVTPQGYLIPGVFSIGNHETNRSRDIHQKAPFFFALFQQTENQETYFTREFGRDLVILSLDSGHVHSHRSQKAWLENQLGLHSDKKYRFASYHVPLYPSHRSFNGSLSKAGREHWLPLFDRFQLTTAFEHHDHVLKRTHSLRGNQVAASGQGTLYLGDGCFGTSPRKAERRWYLETSKSETHFWWVRIDENGALYQAFNEKGNKLDEARQQVSVSLSERSE